MSNETQVLVVGAGPTGLAAAIALAQKGIDVQIVDASPSNKYGARASVVHSHTLDILDTIGSATALVERGIKCGVLSFKSTATSSLADIDFSLIARYTHFPFSLLISQGDVEEILQKQLNGLGLQIQRRMEITGIKKIHDDKAEVLFSDNSTIVTKYIVGADGAHSTIRHLVGIDFINPISGVSYDDPDDSDVMSLTLADVYLEEPLPEHLYKDRPTIILNRGILVLPLPSPDPNRLMWRVVLRMPPGTAVPHNPPIEYIQQLVNEHSPFDTPLIISSLLVSSRYRVRAAIADTYTAKIGNTHVVLIGDAAHVHSPVGGQGMNLGICDAVSAAHAIHTHMNSPKTKDPRKRDAVLVNYGKKRREAGERVIRLAMTMTRFLTLGAGSKWKTALRNALFRVLMSIPPVRRIAAWRVSGLVNRSNDV